MQTSSECIQILFDPPFVSWRTHGFLQPAFLVSLFTLALRQTPFLSIQTWEISLRITSDLEIQLLNAQYRQKNVPTDILSFSLQDKENLCNPPPYGPLALGDIVLSAETVAHTALIRGISLKAHTVHLLIHGFFHLLGYDHETTFEAQHMEQLEIFCLNTLGIENPYV